MVPASYCCYLLNNFRSEHMHWYCIKYNNNIPRKFTNCTMAKVEIMGPMSPLAAPGRHTIAFRLDESRCARQSAWAPFIWREESSGSIIDLKHQRQHKSASWTAVVGQGGAKGGDISPSGREGTIFVHAGAGARQPTCAP